LTGLSSSVDSQGDCSTTATDGAVASLSIDGTPVQILNQRNQVVPVPGFLGAIVLNEVRCEGAITVRTAVHAKLAVSNSEEIDIVVAESTG